MADRTESSSMTLEKRKVLSVVHIDFVSSLVSSSIWSFVALANAPFDQSVSILVDISPSTLRVSETVHIPSSILDVGESRRSARVLAVNREMEGIEAVSGEEDIDRSV